MIALGRRKISGAQIWESVGQTAELASVLFIVIIGGLLFSRFLVVSDFVADLTKMIEIAVITPPVDLNLFAVVSASNGRVRTGELFTGILPFMAMEVVILAILIAFPSISSWLPDTMR